ITPSVAEQEGQQTETEATGAPQKHHYTLNQQVGSITREVWGEALTGVLTGQPLSHEMYIKLPGADVVLLTEG
ncbi:hypothetical protein ACWJPE_28725, partial [Klebsiella pneumoniae]